jgi:aconitate hydratase
MGAEQISGDTAVAYCDHLLVEADSKNSDDHILLQSAARRFGMWFSRPGNGISHPVHQQRFGVPGRTLLGADSHTPGAGGIELASIRKIEWVQSPLPTTIRLFLLKGCFQINAH